MSDVKTETLVKNAVNGDKLAAESLIRLIQDKVYSLCLRMLWQQEDAQEACQEILIKVITHMSQFNFQSKFETWIFQIASNHLIDKKRSSAVRKGLSFSSFEEDLLSEQIDPTVEEKKSPDFNLQLSEIRISCTTALLQCLDADLRLTYILGEIFEFDHAEGSVVLGISSDSYRKRLERAREKVETFTKKVCGVISEKSLCKCSRRLQYAKSCGKIDTTHYPFVKSSQNKKNALEYIDRIEIAKRTAEHYRVTGNFKSPKDFSKILDILNFKKA